MALRKLVGGLLLAAGVLIALSCGLCTGYFGLLSLSLLFDAKSRGGVLFASPFLIAGLVATAVGVGLAYGGVALLRASPGSSENRPPDDRERTAEALRRASRSDDGGGSKTDEDQ